MLDIFLSRWGLCLLHALEDLQQHLNEVRTPLLIIQGEDDKICDPSGARLLQQQAESQDKTLSVRLHNDPYVNDMLNI